MTSAKTAATGEVICEKKNRCGLITLNRPQALNALTHDMIATMEDHYRRWASDPDIYAVVVRPAGGRAFCSGGDLKAMYAAGQKGDLAAIARQYALEYQHNWTLDRFTKPNVALIDGLCLGGGVGICLYGTHRIGTQQLEIGMPETGIGFFPDVGASYFLSRLRGQTGLYLALTGRTVGLADALALDLVTHCIPPDRFDAIVSALMEAEPVDAVLDALHEEPGPAPLDALQPAIDRAFSADSVEAVIARLEAETGQWADWARATADDIRRRSPTGLKVAFRLLREGCALTLDQALVLEYRAARRFIEGTEFFEGIRAAMIDKDGRPRWSPGRLEEVSEAMVEAYLAPLGEDELALMNPFASHAPSLL